MIGGVGHHDRERAGIRAMTGRRGSWRDASSPVSPAQWLEPGRLEVGGSYRITFWSGNGPYRRLVRRTGEFRGLASRTTWDGRPTSVLEFAFPGLQRPSSLVPADVVSIRDAGEQGGVPAGRRANLQRALAQEMLQRVLAS